MGSEHLNKLFSIKRFDEDKRNEYFPLKSRQRRVGWGDLPPPSLEGSGRRRKRKGEEPKPPTQVMGEGV